MKALPTDYRLVFRLDLIHNKKQLRLITALSLGLLALLILPAALTRSLGDTFAQLWPVKVMGLAAGIILYIPLHELVHALFMKLFGCEKVRFGFKLMYAYAGCDEFFYKWPYLIIALAPVVLWGGVLWALACLLPGWFWVVYGVQLLNLSGAAGDIYVTCRLIRRSPSCLVRDSGTAMLVFEKSSREAR